jgi:hypothetical protein
MQLGEFARVPAQTPYPGVERRAFSTSQATIQEYRFEPARPSRSITTLRSRSRS